MKMSIFEKVQWTSLFFFTNFRLNKILQFMFSWRLVRDDKLVFLKKSLWKVASKRKLNIFVFWFLWNLKKNCDNMKVIYMFWFLWNLNAKTSRKMKKKNYVFLCASWWRIMAKRKWFLCFVKIRFCKYCWFIPSLMQ